MVNDTSGTSGTCKSIVLGHPDTLIAEGIASILLKANYKVSGTANTEASLRGLVLKHKPDIIIFEPMICESYADTISAFRQQVPKSVLALVTKRGTFNGIVQAIDAGASGCISVDLSPQDFTRSLQSLLAGDILISKDMTTYAREQSVNKQKPKPGETLSNREREVLSYIGNGLNNHQIARKLFISQNTVKVHVRSILYKLDIKNRQQAAVYAAKEGLIIDINPKHSEDSTP